MSERKNPRALWACALALVLAPAARSESARPIRFDRLSLEEGLSQSAVLTTAQDSHGFLWVGTEDGLNRYDGNRFEVFVHDPRDPGSLPADFVFDLEPRAGGELWIATDGGGLAVRRENGTFEAFLHVPGDPGSISSDRVRVLASDRGGKLWIGTANGLDYFDPESGRVLRRYRHDATSPRSLPNDRVFALYFDDEGDLWVGTDGGLARFSSTDEAFQRVGAPGSAGAFEDQRIRALHQDREGGLWVGTFAGGLYRVEIATGGIVHYSADPADPGSLSHDRVTAVYEDDDGRLWVGTFGGLDLFDRGSRRFDHYRHDDAAPFSLSDDRISCLFQDRGGVLWVGTRAGGLNKWNPDSWNFGYQDPRSSGLGDSNVTSFSVDRKGRLWVATAGGGLLLLDRETGSPLPLPRAVTTDGGRPQDAIMTILEAANGDIWMGTMSSGLCRYREGRPRSDCFRHDSADLSTLASNRIVTALQAADGSIWIGTFGSGLDRLDPDTGIAEHYPPRDDDPNSISAGRVIALAATADDKLWLGTDGGGLNLFDPATGQAIVFQQNPADSQSLASNTVQSLLVTEEGGLWVGTRGGLHRLEEQPSDPNEARFRVYTQRDGLPNDSVYGILPDDEGRLWLSTNLGLSRFDPSTNTFSNYTADRGLQSNEFNFGAAYRASDGELFFGGPQGFNRFMPQRITGNPIPPPVVLTSFLKLNQPVAGTPPERIQSIDLGYDDDVVTFEFAALDYTAPGSNRYSYRLEGFDDDWNEVGNQRRVTYTNLDPGSYVLRVRAANADGVWNEEGLAVPMRVEPPPWRTPLAYGVYALLAAAALWLTIFLVRRRLELQRQYSRRLEREVEERTAELAERARELEELNHKLEHASLTDSLTGLANRRFLTDYADREAALVRRSEFASNDSGASETVLPTSLAFLMVDLDDFKAMNDSHGHAAGDALLLRVRDVLREVCRASDVLVRWGGDEFLVVGRDADVAHLEALAERIRSRIAREAIRLPDDREVGATCSIGFAVYPFVASEPEALSWEQVVGVADRALYVAKQSSRNAWVGFVSKDSSNGDGQLGDLLAAIWDCPEKLIESGRLEVRKSVPDHRLRW